MELLNFGPKKLGFGCMRLPMSEGTVGGEGVVDTRQVCAMVDAFLEQGFCYFDTAHGYIAQKSEPTVRQCLVERHPRDRFLLTDKLSGTFFQTEEEIRPFFESQLEIIGAGYFDFYLMHALNANQYQKFTECNAFQVAQQLKNEGKIRHVGISFHDTPEVLPGGTGGAALAAGAGAHADAGGPTSGAVAVSDAAGAARFGRKREVVSKNVLQTIRSRTDSFSRGQKRIADYILMNYDKAAFMTAGHLGRKAQVSESTVVRFASQLGYDGYPNMQRALQELVRGKLTSLQRIQVSRDQMQEQDVLTGVMQRDMNSIHTAIESVDRAAFDQVVDRLLASHIYLMGVRSSAFLAGYLNFYLHLMFKNVTLVQNAAAGEIFEQLSQIGPGDVLVGISFPRYSQMAIHAVEYARDRGADVVAITDGQMSPLYRMATVSLLVRSDMISFVDSMAAPLSLLNALIVAVGRQKNEEVSGTFSQLENVWSKYNIFGKTEDES